MRFLKAALAVPLVSLALSAGSAHASILIDGGFEAPAVTTAGFQSGYFPYTPGESFGGPSNDAWTVVGSGSDVAVTNTGEYTTGPTYYNGHSGSQWLDLTGTHDNGARVGVQQTVATVANTEY